MEHTKLIITEGIWRGKLRFKLFQLEIFNILLYEMGYSFIRWNGKGKFLKSVPGGYKIVHFQHLKDSFTTYLREDFDSSLLPEGIYYEDLMNKYYQSNPITGLYARSYFPVEHKLNESDFILDGGLLKYK